MYIIDGDITLNGRDYLTAGSYLYRPSGIVHGHNEGSISGCRCIIRTDGLLDFTLIPNPSSPDEYVEMPSSDGRPHVLHLRAPDLDWTWHGEGRSRYGIKTLSEDRANGSTTSLVRLPAGWTGEFNLEAGIAWEWFVVSGQTSMSDGIEFEQESYSYRPAAPQPLAFTRAQAQTDVLLWRIT